MRTYNAGPFALGASYSAANLTTSLFTSFANAFKRSCERDELPYEYYEVEDVERMKERWTKADHDLRMEHLIDAVNREQRHEKVVEQLKASMATRLHLDKTIGAFKSWLSPTLCQKHDPAISRALTGNVPEFANCCIYAAVEMFSTFQSDTYYVGALASKVLADPDKFTALERTEITRAVQLLSIKGLMRCTLSPEEVLKDWAPIYQKIYARGQEIWEALSRSGRLHCASPNVSSDLFNQTRHELAGHRRSLNLTRSLIAHLPANSNLAKELAAIEAADRLNTSRPRDPRAFELGQTVTLYAQGTESGRQVVLAPRTVS